MTKRWAGVLRFGRMTLQLILLILLLAWTMAAPFVWLLRDGLGPDSVETGWIEGAFKFLVAWGVPALVLAAPLGLLALFDIRAEKDGTGRRDPPSIGAGYTRTRRGTETDGGSNGR